uniref:DNA repair protein REV1 n=1 Tax=Syphacia muris TaxID=451379 RepID=A0A158R405_9BILA
MEDDLEKPETSTGKNNEWEKVADQWKTYMAAKKSKLMHQINGTSGEGNVSNIFKGVSIFVNGYTDPPASELRRIIQLHGGEYHVYYEYGLTTYTVATHIAKGKLSKLRKDEKIVHPQYIIDCVKANKRLSDEDYLLCKDNALPNKISKKCFESSRNAGNDPNFISNFYGRSRLHLISTLAQEMKQFVQELRQSPPEVFHSRHLLLPLSKSDFIKVPKETICHIDLDCFFVSVALRSCPDLVGKPVAVTHSRGTNYGAGLSDIASCSYEARAAGVKNGMSVREAKKLCPNIICVPYQFEDYRTTSTAVYEIISRYTVDIRAVSCDEVYVDLSSLCKDTNVDDIMGIVSIIREEIHRETGCIASVGIGSNMLIARLATRHAKPNGQFLVKDEEISSFIKKEKVSSLPGIGYSTRAKAVGTVDTCEELQNIPVERLQTLFGAKTGLQIYNLSRGIDKDRDLLEISSRKSVSCDVNYGILPSDKEMNELADYFFQLVEYEDYSTLVSQVRFIERKALDCFADWVFPIIALKMFLKEVCYSQLGHHLIV